MTDRIEIPEMPKEFVDSIRKMTDKSSKDMTPEQRKGMVINARIDTVIMMMATQEGFRPRPKRTVSCILDLPDNFHEKLATTYKLMKDVFGEEIDIKLDDFERETLTTIFFEGVFSRGRKLIENFMKMAKVIGLNSSKSLQGLSDGLNSPEVPEPIRRELKKVLDEINSEIETTSKDFTRVSYK